MINLSCQQIVKNDLRCNRCSWRPFNFTPHFIYELGIEDEMLGQCAVLILPELDEAEDLFCLLAFADIGIGIAEHLRIRILRQKGEDAGLPAASL